MLVCDMSASLVPLLSRYRSNPCTHYASVSGSSAILEGEGGEVVIRDSQARMATGAKMTFCSHAAPDMIQARAHSYLCLIGI